MASIAACLPEQFIRIRDMGSPRAIIRWAVCVSSGQAAGQRRSSSLRPAPDKIFRTPSTWKSSPEWLAAASASSSASRFRPQRSIAVACSGLFADRGRNGTSVRPALRTGTDNPSSASTAASRSADPGLSAHTVTEYPSSASAANRAASRDRSPCTGSHPWATTPGVALDVATGTMLSTGAGHRSRSRS